jgi:inorganic pyrophosphatase
MTPPASRLDELVSLMFQAHPWHGIPARDRPDRVTGYIEIGPTDVVKYELDKPSGHLRIDRPQRYSSVPPTLYGFIPQTYCAEKVAERCMERRGLTGIRGDGDPLDICVLSEKQFTTGNFLLRARPIGGLRMIDASEADDKIVAVLEDDVVYGSLNDLSEAPLGLVERLRHYFLSYKQLPSESPRRVTIDEIYGRAEALETIDRSEADYRAHFGAPEGRLAEFKRLLTSP